MFKRSPQVLRSGAKGKPVPLSTAVKPKLQRSLSASSSDGAPNMTDSSKPTLDPTLVKQHVDSYLTNEDFFSKLVERMSQEIKSAVEVAVRAAVSSLQDEVSKLRDEVKVLTEKLSELDGNTKDRTDDLEQYQRRNNLRFFGLEETPREDTDEIIKAVCREKLGFELPDNAICRSHRVGSQPKSTTDGRKRHRPIIVRFTGYRHRQKVFVAKKKLKGTQVTIHEDLTARRMEVYRTAAETHGPRNTWTLDGRIIWVDEHGNKGMATRLVDL